MTVELSEDEIGIITQWYNAAANESYGADNDEQFRLLEKLGIEAAPIDLYLPIPEHWIESHRPAVLAQVAAIKGYMERNPNLEVVKEAQDQ